MADDEWYWMQAGQSCGPATLAELDALYRRNEVSSETLVWRLGQDRWKSLSEILPNITKLPPPLPDSAGNASPSSAPSPQATETKVSLIQCDDRWSDTAPHPWRRYFARVFDTLVNSAITTGIVAFLFALADSDVVAKFFAATGGNRLVDGMLTFMAAIPLNAALVGLTGGTLGKWLFGVRILDHQSQPIGFVSALSREVAVWFQGLALGIPLLSLFTTWAAFKKLSTTGITSWDSTRAIFVVHRPKGARQAIGATIGVVSLLCVIVALQALAVA